MSNYIPNGQKKNKIFKKREIELVHAIKNNLHQDRIIKAAESLREAKLQVIRIQVSLSKKVSLEEAISRREANWEKWTSFSVEEIIQEYAKKT